MFLKLVTTEERSSNRYFLIDVENNLIFIPLSNKYKNIIDYTVTNINQLDKIRIYNFYLCITIQNKKY